MRPRHILIFCILFLISYPAAAQSSKPKLVVGIVIDQMRWDYLYRYNALYGANGFKRLLGKGFSCENTMIPYVPTYTAVGHTCIYTGSVPAITGIVGNNWFDKTTNAAVYCTDGGGATCVVADVSMCASSTSMGSVSGDTGAGVKTATGSNGQWLKIDVTENDSSLFSSVDLKVRITLDSPAGENFDLYVYMGKTKADGGGIECTTVAGSSTLATGQDVVSLGWPDKRPIGGSDDSRTLSIEVRPAGEPCDASATWTLTVLGHK